MSTSVSEIAALWNRILEQINKDLNDNRVFDTFFTDSYIEDIQGNKMIVIVNSGVAASVLSNKYKVLISESIKKCTGTEFETIFYVAGEYKKNDKIQVTKPDFFASATISTSFTFENFVVGACNKEAYQASLMTSKNGSMFNPLFIYSDSGLGKTHLLQAIGNAFREEAPSKKVLYISASDFIDEFIKSLDSNHETKLIDYFKENVDVLLLDDVQYLIGKKATMDMFFNVFQALYNKGKQIVLTSDQHPSQLDGLPDRLKTRFQQGLTLSISAPDIETATNILKSKIEARGLDLNMFDEEVLRFYGERFSTSVRSLESALNRLIFYTININPTNHIDLNVGKLAVGDFLHIQDDEGKLSEKKIITTVSDYYNLTPSQLTGKIRTAQIALARHIAMYLIRTLLDTPFDKIGKTFSGKDHSTVMSGVDKVEKMLKTDPELAEAVLELKKRLKTAD